MAWVVARAAARIAMGTPSEGRAACMCLCGAMWVQVVCIHACLLGGALRGAKLPVPQLPLSSDVDTGGCVLPPCSFAFLQGRCVGRGERGSTTFHA